MTGLTKNSTASATPVSDAFWVVFSWVAYIVVTGIIIVGIAHAWPLTFAHMSLFAAWLGIGQNLDRDRILDAIRRNR